MNECRQLDELDAADLEKIDAACDRYSASLQTIPLPSLRDTLNSIPESLRQLLLPELIELDAAHRQKTDQPVSRDFYLDQFPEWSDHLRPILDEILKPPSHSRAFPVVPGYEIEEEIGRGGMGVVYRARQISLNRTVALKIAATHFGSSPEVLRRFQREAESTAKLQHPNIVKIFEVGSVDGAPYYTMEFIDGPNLAQVLATTGLAPQDSAILIQRLALAVAAAHESGIVHRDIKPPNVMLQGTADDSGFNTMKPTPGKSSIRKGETAGSSSASQSTNRNGLNSSGGLSTVRNGRSVLSSFVPRLTDFGLAKHIESDLKTTQTGLVMGTPGYMAPEQARGSSQEIGPLVDVYSLGAILYECLCGRPPFRASTMVETLRLVQAEDPVPPSRLQTKVPADLETICLKCLEKQPEKRYAGAIELADDLSRFLSGLAIKARPATPFDLLIRWARRKPAIATMSAALAVLILTVITVPSIMAIRLDRARKESDSSARNAEANLRLANAKTKEADSQRSRALHLAAESQSRLAGMRIANGVNSQLAAHHRSAMLWFTKAWDDDAYQSRSELHHRLRIGFARQALPELSGLCIHNSAIVDAAFDKGMTRVLVQDESNDLTLWDPWTARALSRIPCETPPTCIRLSADATLALLGEGSTVRVIDVQSGATRFRLSHPEPVQHLAVHPSSFECLTACNDGHVRKWNLENGEQIPLVLSFGSPVRSVQFSPTEQLAIAVTEDSRVHIWQVADGLPVDSHIEHEMHGDSRHCLHPLFSGDGKRLLTFRMNELTLWRTPNWRKLWAAHIGADVSNASIDHAGLSVAFPSGSTAGVLFRLSGQGTSERVLLQNSRNTHFATVSPDGAWSAVECSGGLISIFDNSSGQQFATIKHADDLTLMQCRARPDGQSVLVAGGLDGTLRFWTVRQKSVAEASYDFSCGQSHEIGIQTVDGSRKLYSPDGQSEVRIDGNIATLHERHSGMNRGVDFTLSEEISNGRISADGKCLLLIGQTSFAVFDTATGTAVDSSICLPEPLLSFEMSSDGHRILVVLRSGRWQVWHVDSGKTLLDSQSDLIESAPKEFSKMASSEDAADSDIDTPTIAQKVFVPAVHLAPNGNMIVVKRKAASHSVIRVDDGETLFQTDRQRGVAAPVAFSSNGSRFLVVNSDMKARVWDLNSRQPVGPFLTHATFARYGCLNSDGTLAATYCADKYLRIWSAETGDLLHASLFGPKHHIWFSSDSASLNIRKPTGELTRLLFSPFPGPKDDCQMFTELICGEFIDETEGISPVPPDHFRSRPEQFLSVWQQTIGSSGFSEIPVRSDSVP